MRNIYLLVNIEISYILAPVVGGIIGYITNDIAIRMLFRPHKAKYIFGVRIPFTPGIIPKEKGRIAIALGSVISKNLMNKEVLQKNLLSVEMIEKIQNSIDTFFEQQKNNQETVREFLSHYLTPDDIDKLIINIKSGITSQVSGSICESNIGEQISEIVVDHISSKLKIDGLNINIPKMMINILGTSIWEHLANIIEKPAKNFISHNINQILSSKGPKIIENIVNKGINDFSILTMHDLLQGKDEHVAQIRTTLIGLYKTIISDYLPRILETINIPIIIESRINEMDMNETEKLIFEVMDKELKAIVWLGALLGFLMGSINLFF